jgi:hypothetical protein
LDYVFMDKRVDMITVIDINKELSEHVCQIHRTVIGIRKNQNQKSKEIPMSLNDIMWFS